MSGENPTTDGGAGLDFGRYRLRRLPDGSAWKLGSGAMGVTYRAFDERLDVDVALKVIAPAHLEDLRARALFLREARAAARVRHENVAGVVYLNDEPGNFFLVMEFVEGDSLDHWLRAQDVLSPLLATEFAIQIARGLEAIHGQKIVHRDLKPANLMIVPAGSTDGADGRGLARVWRVKIIDFGLARAFAATGLETQAGAPTQGFVGTAAYASPEQCAEFEEIDGRADLYALGCILWEMLTGAPPFRAASQRELMNQHVSQLPPLARITFLPPSLVEVLGCLLAKDPDFRFPDAGAAASALERCRDRIASGAEVMDERKRVILRADPLDPPAGMLSSSAADAPRFGSFVPLLVAVLLALLFVSGWLRWHRGEETRAIAGPSIAMPRLHARKTIAVLPFTNLSPDENASMAVALQQEILASLEKIGGLKVVINKFEIGRGPANHDLLTVAAELGAGSLLEGSVRHTGNHVRVSVQLIEPASGENLWAESFDLEEAGVHEIPDRIAREVAAALAADVVERGH